MGKLAQRHRHPLSQLLGHGYADGRADAMGKALELTDPVQLRTAIGFAAFYAFVLILVA
jgi:hypothetical protein